MYLNDLLLYVYGINNLQLENIYINKFCINSNDIKLNDAFICLNSGYKYIDDAIKNGAKIIISEKNIKVSKDIIFLKVQNAFKFLKKITEFILTIHHPKVIAITGSNGKTTTKELLYQILMKQYRVLKNEGNKNNLIGLCETVLKLKDEEYLILELGMNHKGEISEMSKLIKPDMGIITNIGSAHIGNLGSKKNIFKAKMELLDGNNEMKLFVNGDDLYLRKLNCFKVYSNELEYQPPFSFMKINYALAATVSQYLKVNKELIYEVFNSYNMYNQRMNIYNLDSNILIDDTYNASLESIIGAFSYIKEQNIPKLIILGDIMEAGKYSKKIHKKINKSLKKINNKQVLLVGKYTKYIKGIHFKDNVSISKYLDNLVIKNTLIYLKGSRAMNLEYIRDNLLRKI